MTAEKFKAERAGGKEIMRLGSSERGDAFKASLYCTAMYLFSVAFILDLDAGEGIGIYVWGWVDRGRGN